MTRYYPIEIGSKTIQLPSVTTQIMELNAKGLLGEPLMFKNKEESLDIGSQVHAIIDRIIKGGNVRPDEWFALDERVRQGVRAFERFRQAQQFRAHESEITVYSLKYGYAGTIDAIGSCNHRIAIVDWKTGNMPAWYVDTQLAMYWAARMEMFPRRRISYLWQVNLDKKLGEYSLHGIPASEAPIIFNKYLELKEKAGLN